MLAPAHPVIIAVASPPGRSLRGIVRLSGHRALELVGQQLIGAPRLDRGLHRAVLALQSTTLETPRPLHLPCLALAMPGPRSYTGEDSVELQVPGNPVLLARVIEQLLAAARVADIPARHAQPGEFTARAFLNGRMSITQAEGVAATIAARSDAEWRAARLLTSGALGMLAAQLADDLASALALVEAGIDFTDQEDVVAIAPDDLHDRLRALRDRVQAHLDRSTGFEQLQAIPWVVLTGLPNAGKSALFNAMLGRERAVVSPIAGTTRDILAEPLRIQTGHGPAEVMLIDLAGLDEIDDSPMNRLMQARAREAIERAELVLRCVPVNDPVEPADSSGILLVRTKGDLLASAAPIAGIAVSAHAGDGLDELRDAIAQRLGDRAVSLAADALALGPRHQHAMRSALDHLREAIALTAPQAGMASLSQVELIASAMRAALNDLAELAGEISPDDILGRVFATFCVGK